MRTTALPETTLFDFLGTLVGYSPSRSSQGYRDSDALLRAAGLTRTYDDWLVEWETSYADFETTYLREWNGGITDIVGLRGMLEQLAEGHRFAVVANTNEDQLATVLDLPATLTRHHW